jgi:hypothetical protein
MRIIRLADIPVVVHIRYHGEVCIAVPALVPNTDVLAMASLILSDDEFAELTKSLMEEAAE